MLSAHRLRSLRPAHVEDVPAQAYLAVIAAVVAVLSLPAALGDDPVDRLVFIGVALLLVAFTASVWLHGRGRSRDAALLTATALVLAHFAFAHAYPQAPALVLASPIAFMLVVRHLRGRQLAAFAVFAMAPVVWHAVVVTLGRDDVVYGAPASILAATAATLMVFVLAWRAQRIAERQTARYRDLVVELPVGVVRVGGDDGRILQANPAFARALGEPSADAVLGRELAAYLVEPLDEAFARARRDHPEMPSAELEIRRPDGSTGWLRATGRRRPLPDGGTVVDAVVEDITGERAARSAVERLAAIVDSATDGILGVDLGGTVTSANRAAAGALGRPTESLVGLSIFDLANEGERELLEDADRAIREGREVDPVEIVRPAPDGTPMTVSIATSPIIAGGAVAGFALIARDLTEQRRAEAERATLEAQLRQAQKMEAIGRLAGGVAHDFNNLLTAILGYGRMVAERVSDQVLEDQRVVIRAAERASEVTGRLLSFSRQSTPDPRPIHIDDTLTDALAMVTRLVPERIELEAAFESAAAVLVDPVDLEQVLLNLVTNAVDATPDTGRILVRTTRVELSRAFVAAHTGARTGPHVCLEVIDTGTGMDAATLAHVFEPFFTTKPVGEGTGLGLAMVYGVVQRAGGTVWLESAPGAGTTIAIYLPVVEGAIEPPRRRFEYVPTGNERVLLVEDDEDVRALATRILDRAGYRVHAVETAEEALRFAATEPVDVLVSDVVLPRLSGPELLGRLAPGMAAVFMSGYAATASGLGEADEPCRAFVAKPFEPVELAHAVRGVLDGRAREP